MQSAMEKQAAMMVTKRDGRMEPIDLDKIHRVIDWAANGLENVSVSQVEMRSHIQFYDGIRTDAIHETIIKSAADLISEETPNYQYLAARLAIFHLRKIAYGQFEPPHLYDHVRNLTEQGKYDAHLLADYSREEFDELNGYINHWRDMNFAYAAVKQMEGKYLIQNRVTKRIYESPQFLYLLVAMCLFAKYPAQTRLGYVKRFYDAVSRFKISLPTPIMAGVRTPMRQFSSCVLIECDDDLDSVNATTSAIVKYVSQRAGIGINGGRIRALGSEIRGGEALHTGCLPFFKMFQAAVKSCSQGGVRGGAATLFYPLWHLEVESLLVLKNNRGVEENRIRHLDYGVQVNRLLYQRLIKSQDITLFSPHDTRPVRSLLRRPGRVRAPVPAIRAGSRHPQAQPAGRGTVLADDAGARQHRPHLHPERRPLQHAQPVRSPGRAGAPVEPVHGNRAADQGAERCQRPGRRNRAVHAVGLQPGRAGNAGRAGRPGRPGRARARRAARLPGLSDPGARAATMKRRPLGVGVINYAYYLAKHGTRYSEPAALGLTHRTFEAIQYYLLKASSQLAREFGPCSGFNETTYSAGVLPIDSYKKDVDGICAEPLRLDWEALRADIREHGLRNSTLTALMPSETSSQIANATNGIEPPRGLVSVKQSKDGILRQVVPEFERLKDKYELLWQMSGNESYLKLVGIMQKFVDQSISANTNYDPQRYEGGRVPMKQLLRTCCWPTSTA